MFFVSASNVKAEEKLLVALHGFLRSKGNFQAFHKEYTQLGWHVYRWNYPSWSKTIEENAKDFTEQMNKIQNELPPHKVYFVTHSLGGLILRAAMNREGFPENYKSTKALLIAPPNQGSAFARFLGQYKALRLAMGSKAGKELVKKESFDHLGIFPDSLEVMVIAGTCGFNPLLKGKNDGKVTIKETRLKTPHQYKEVFAGHSWIAGSKETIKESKKFFGISS